MSRCSIELRNIYHIWIIYRYHFGVLPSSSNMTVETCFIRHLPSLDYSNQTIRVLCNMMICVSYIVHPLHYYYYHHQWVPMSPMRWKHASTFIWWTWYSYPYSSWPVETYYQCAFGGDGWRKRDTLRWLVLFFWQFCFIVSCWFCWCWLYLYLYLLVY